MPKLVFARIESDGLTVRLPSDAPDVPLRRFGDPADMDASVRKALSGSRCVALVPTQDCLLRHLELPLRNEKQLQVAVPFALEDELAADLGKLHIAVATHPGGTVDAVVVAHEKIQAWQQLLERFGVRADAMLPSALALPLDEGVWHMNLERDLVEVRQGELAGFAVEAESLPDWLRLAATPLIEQGGRPLLAVHGDDPAAVALLADDLGKAGWSIRQTDCPASESSSWAGPLPDINLLQGKYGRDHCGKGAARNWMWAAAWILLWGLAETGYVAWDNSRLRGRIDDMTAQLKSVYLSADPEATRVVNPRAQMKQLLASRTDSDDRGFLGLLRMVGDGFANIKNGEIARLSFNQGKLDMEAKLDAVSTVEKLKNGLAERNVVLSVLSLNTVEQGIEAHLRAEERLP